MSKKIERLISTVLAFGAMTPGIANLSTNSAYAAVTETAGKTKGEKGETSTVTNKVTPEQVQHLGGDMLEQPNDVAPAATKKDAGAMVRKFWLQTYAKCLGKGTPSAREIEEIEKALPPEAQKKFKQVFGGFISNVKREGFIPYSKECKGFGTQAVGKGVKFWGDDKFPQVVDVAALEAVEGALGPFAVAVARSCALCVLANIKSVGPLTCAKEGEDFLKYTQLVDNVLRLFPNEMELAFRRLYFRTFLCRNEDGGKTMLEVERSGLNDALLPLAREKFHDSIEKIKTRNQLRIDGLENTIKEFENQKKTGDNKKADDKKRSAGPKAKK